MSTDEPRPRSQRRPWVRGGLFGLLPVLLPYVWVVEISSCGHDATQTEFTGLELMKKLDSDDLFFFIPVLVLSVLAPFVAREVKRYGWQLTVHGLGAVATALLAWVGLFVITFTIFAERTFRGVGWVVVAALLAAVADALMRVVRVAQEWRAAVVKARTP